MTEPVPNFDRVMVHINNLTPDLRARPKRPLRRVFWSFAINFAAIAALFTVVSIGCMFLVHFALLRAS